MQAQDPFEFASEYLQGLQIPKIIYRPAGKFSADELSSWLEDLHKHNFYPVFVGVPAPDYPVKTSLQEAYKIWSRHKETSVIGAVTIPERHEVLKDEDKRILDKAGCGVSYFISQCVFNIDYAKNVIEDLNRTCKTGNVIFPTVIFTLAVCGSEKTLEFMEWLGIHVPDNLQEDFRGSKNMLEKSVQVCLDIAAELTTFCADRSIPFGFNIESVAVRSDEIEASVYLVNKVREILVQGGIRKTEVSTFSANTIRDLNEEGVAIDKDKRQVNIIK
jgi:5,10-methylenetetrahydrofolate reductase